MKGKDIASMKDKVITVTAHNGIVEMSREDFILLMRLAGVTKVSSVESISLTTPAKRGPEPGTVVRKGAKQKGGKKV